MDHRRRRRFNQIARTLDEEEGPGRVRVRPSGVNTEETVLSWPARQPAAGGELIPGTSTDPPRARVLRRLEQLLDELEAWASVTFELRSDPTDKTRWTWPAAAGPPTPAKPPPEANPAVDDAAGPAQAELPLDGRTAAPGAVLDPSDLTKRDREVVELCLDGPRDVKVIAGKLQLRRDSGSLRDRCNKLVRLLWLERPDGHRYQATARAKLALAAPPAGRAG